MWKIDSDDWGYRYERTEHEARRFMEEFAEDEPWHKNLKATDEDTGRVIYANAARSTNSIVAKALNAVVRNANGLDGLIADLDSGKYDSINWMPKVIGPGTLYPDGMKFPTGLGYDDEEKVRAAWKSGKYASVMLYKGGSKRGEIPVNADMSTVSEKAVNAKFYVGDKVRIKNPNRQIGQDDGIYEVTLIRPDGMISVKAPSEKVGFAVRPEQLIANAARNDVLGRYKPGARVAVELRTRPIVGKVMQYGGRPEVEYSPTTRTRFTGTLIKQNGDKWDIKSDSGEVYKSVSEADFGLSYNSRSRNSVVQKALNAHRARNDEQFHTYLVPVLRKGVKDYVTIERVADEKTAKELVDVPSFRIIGVTVDETRPVKMAKNAKALNYSPYRKGAWLHDDKGREYTVVEEEHWGKNGGAERIVTIRDEQTKQTREVPVTELDNRFDFGEATNAATARNAIGRDKQDAASVELWAGMFENNFLKFVLPKSTDKAKARKTGESIIKRVEEALGSEGGREQLKRMGWTIQRMRDELEKGLNAATTRNAVAMNWNFKNGYQFFCVDPSLKAPCILSGWDYREDAKDDAAELKEVGIPHKIVSRRFLEQQGIDPNAESSWKKNRQ